MPNLGVSILVNYHSVQAMYSLCMQAFLAVFLAGVVKFHVYFLVYDVYCTLCMCVHISKHSNDPIWQSPFSGFLARTMLLTHMNVTMQSKV